MQKEEESGFYNHSVCIKYKNSLPFTYNRGIISHVILEQILYTTAIDFTGYKNLRPRIRKTGCFTVKLFFP